MERVRISAQRERTIMVLSMVVMLIGSAAFLTFDRGPTGNRIRELLGFDGRINATVSEGQPGGHFAFLQTQPGSDDPVGFSPCREIHYVVNPDGAPQGWEDLVSESIDEVGARTGLAFEYDGTTDDRDFGNRMNDADLPAPVLIGWADSEEVPELEGSVAGLGGATQVERGGRRGYVTGMVVLDTTTTDELASQPDSEVVHRALLLHELGHLVGLDHVSDQGELMYGEGVTRPSYGTGDRRGLARLGAIPCA